MTAANLPSLPKRSGTLTRAGLEALPAVFTGSPSTTRRFIEFFTAQIRNRNTREAYARAVKQFAAWLEESRIDDLTKITPVVVAAYVEQLLSEDPRRPGRIGNGRAPTQLAKPSVKQHLAAIRTLFDYLVTGGIIPFNPASSVRGPKYVVSRGKTPVLDDDQMQDLLDSIDPSTPMGLRDKALIAVMSYDFARIGAVVAMNVEDYYQSGKRWALRLHEKGGKRHEMLAHHLVEEALDAYLEALGPQEKRSPLFRTARRRSGQLTENRLTENDALRMVKRRAKTAGLPASTCNHAFRATCITNFRRNGGSRSKAAQLAAHASERTTAMYDRSDDTITLDEIERVNYRRN